MYSNILIATDLSRDSDELVRCASGLRKAGCRSAHLVYGIEIDNIGGALRADIERMVKSEMDRQKAVLEQSGIQTATHVVMSPTQWGRGAGARSASFLQTASATTLRAASLRRCCRYPSHCAAAAIRSASDEPRNDVREEPRPRKG